MLNYIFLLTNSISKYIIHNILINFLAIFILSFIVTFINIRMTKPKFQKKELLEEVNYFRDIPFENIEEAFYFGSYYGLVENVSDFIGAILLKWLKEDKIDIITKDSQTFIDLRNFFKTEDNYERDIYIKLLIAADSNNILEEREFKRVFDSEEDLCKLFKKINYEVEEKLTKEGLMEKRVVGTKEELYITDELKEKIKQLKGLKKFLSDFSNIKDRQSISVTLWEDYLIYAQMFGIASQVQEEFNHIYPDFNKIYNFNIAKAAIIKSLSTSLNLTIKIIMHSINEYDK